MYRTRQKTLILETLKQSDGQHLTVDDLVRQLQNKQAKVGKTTVYRYLEYLTEEGIVRKYRLDDGLSACYQYMDNPHAACKEHFHLKCTDCGALIHLDCEKLTALHTHIAGEHGFRIDRERTVFYGTCKKCLAKREEMPR